ncbi:PIN-like domain-containing protein [Streptomyces sp. NPDC057445]|uniref:PIN-like domain-containing protein n=1 Tax=Streptomyces sp. NPDC057445 TaxID=3346136 RepID=UPI0036CD647C
MIVLDTNVLLNLYRYNARTREDTLAVLSRLRARLWVPHQVLTGFRRNRELRSVRHHHSTKAKETSAALDKARRGEADRGDDGAEAGWTRQSHCGCRPCGPAAPDGAGALEGRAAPGAVRYRGRRSRR